MSFSVVTLPYADNISSLAFCFKDADVVLLDSPNTSHPDGRWSILCANPIASVKIGTRTPSDVKKFKQKTKEFSALLTTEDEDHDLPFTGGVIGLVSYDIGITEAGIDLDLNAINKNPMAISHLFAWAFLWDHHKKQSFLAIHEPQSKQDPKELIHLYQSSSNETENTFKMDVDSFNDHWTFQEYSKAFSKVKEFIMDGDVYQINLTQKYSAKFDGQPLNGYLNLRSKANAPFSLYWGHKDWQLVSVSPERFIKVRNSKVETKPIKGTRPNNQDLTAIHDLKNSRKDQAENVMIVDLLRNDISKHCKNVSVPKLFDVESFPTVHHLVSTVTGQLNHQSSALDLFWDAFPGGSITGAPKKRAMEIIDLLEESGRSFYCGSVFYQSSNGNFDSNILIRSFEFKSNVVSTWAGGGIVFDSVCENEFQECADKIEKLMTWLQ